MVRHRSPRHGPPDPAIRGVGLIALLAGAASLRALFLLGLTGPQAPDGPVPYLLALLGFAGAVGGSAMLALGHHLFDRIAVSRRWAARRGEMIDIGPIETERPPRPDGAPAARPASAGRS